MFESEAMLWVRKVRDENSVRHAKMTLAEMRAEADEAIKLMEKMTGKTVVRRPAGATARAGQ